MSFSFHRMDESNSLFYKRSLFVTRLPLNYLYTASHYWLCQQEGKWRVGLTKFATRLVGEMVDFGFDTQPGSRVRLGQVIGWLEGLKTISDLLSVVEGTFERGNPQLS